MTTATTVVDVSPVLDLVIKLLVALALLVGSWLLHWLVRRVKLLNNAGFQAAWTDALDKSLTWAATQSTAIIKAKGWDHPDTHAAVIATAAEYLLAKFPAALAGVGLSANSVAADVLAALQRQLPATFATLVNNPALPAAIAPASVVINADLDKPLTVKPPVDLAAVLVPAAVLAGSAASGAVGKIASWTP